VNYSAVEALLIMGLPTSDIESTLGYQGDEELIRRDNLVLF
jgi:glutamate 5-kinase